MKTTKKQARSLSNRIQGILYNLNGGTREENLAMAPGCYAQLAEVAEESRTLAANPSRSLAADGWEMERLEGIPLIVELFRQRYEAAIWENPIVVKRGGEGSAAVATSLEEIRQSFEDDGENTAWIKGFLLILRQNGEAFDRFYSYKIAGSPLTDPSNRV